MPASLARKVLIAAAVDGLLIQPLSTKREQRPSSPIKIRYGDSAISFASRDALPDSSTPNSSFEAFGIVGTLSAPALDLLRGRLFAGPPLCDAFGPKLTLSKA